ncbi:MAG: DUF3368 domain-containing protein [Phycisphaerales bacterium]|nr:DUF3368 domain-containing protein [Phycisphaerales bacterium]
MYAEVLIPPGVVAELLVPVRGLPSFSLEACPFLKVCEPSDAGRVDSMRASLDRGEAEAIALAIELHAETVLIDERRGRRVARRMGLVTVGVIGLLQQAKEAGRIAAIAPLVVELRNRIGFRVSEGILASVLRDAGEGP